VRKVFGSLKPGAVEAVVIASYVIRHRYQMLVLQLATEKKIAAIGSRRDVVEKGALFAYAYDFAKVGRAAAARYVDPILKGARPGDLPIEEVTDNELVVNGGVARRHGWTIPQSILLRAARIIG
jgi:putative ABC transport system substrate-binding protein